MIKLQGSSAEEENTSCLESIIMTLAALQAAQREDEYKDSVGLLMPQMDFCFILSNFILLALISWTLRNAQPSKMSRKVTAKPHDSK